MRTAMFFIPTILVIIGALLVYDRTRSTPSVRPRNASESAMERRLQALEARTAHLAAGLVGDVAGSPPAGETTTMKDPRLHADAPPADLPEATITRTKAALDDLRAKRLQEDERAYVDRRLGELAVGLTPTQKAAARTVVIDYFHAKAAAWRKAQDSGMDPTQALAIFDAIARRHHAQLAQALKNEGLASRIANALMPLR